MLEWARLACLPFLLCSLMHHVCWTGPNLFMRSPMHHVCVFVYRVKSGMCSLMHRIYLEWGAQICFMCSLMHLVCSVCRRVPTSFCARQCTTSVVSPRGSKSVSVLTNAPRLCVCLKDPSLVLCSLMHHVCWIGPNLFSVLTNAPRLCVRL